ncbi:MAG: hypothetical protein HYS43_01965 [Candidatus Liptonbacteria bacterium]|nr:hypothetical protein [Candidatus Liptonbacteria bacterium]
MKFLFPLAFAAFDGYKITTPFGGLQGGQTYSIAQYITVILTFSFGAIGVVALGAIVYWSLKWILSQGNASAIAQAKEGIWSAVWGVILLFASYVILNTINPALVNLQATESNLTLPRVTRPSPTHRDAESIPEIPRGSTTAGGAPEVCPPPTDAVNIRNNSPSSNATCASQGRTGGYVFIKCKSSYYCIPPKK